MRATNERFVRLRNKANLQSGRTNADFLIALMDRYEGLTGESVKEMHSVEVQANSTESVFELYAQREVKKIDFQCQWPCGEAPLSKQILSPAREAECFLSVGRIASLYCCRKLLQDVPVDRNTFMMAVRISIWMVMF